MQRHIDYKGYSCWSDLGMMTPAQYIKMIDLLEEYHPSNICELGSGQSTEIFDYYIKKSYTKLSSIENDIYYMTHKNNILMSLNKYVDLSLQNHQYKHCILYDGLEKWLINQEKFDFILIDGPNDVVTYEGYDNSITYSRVQLLSFIILDKLSNNAIIMYHDSNLKESQNTLNEFEKLLKEHNFNYTKEIIIEIDKEIIDNYMRYLPFCPELVIYKIQKVA